MTPHVATGTFADTNNADDAQSYLLANDFLEGQLKFDGLTLNISTQTVMEAQEAVDVLRNYGASDISMHEVQ